MEVNSINANTGLRLKAPRFLSIPFQFSGGGGKITIPTGPQSIGNSIQPQYVFIDNSANQGILILQAGGLNYIIAPMATSGFPVVMGDTSEIKLLSNIGAVGTVILTDTAISPFDNNPNVNGVTITTALPSGTNSIGSVSLNPGTSKIGTVNNIPVSNLQRMVDYSGTISTANTSQQAVASGDITQLLMIQNLGSTPLYVNFGSANAATSGAGSIAIQQYDYLIFRPDFLPVGAINVLSATAGAPYTIKGY